MTKRHAGATGVVVAALLAGCGGGQETSGAQSANARPLVVSAAASLQKAFTDYGDGFGGQRPRFSFAGSDELAAQIRQGVKPDVFASANTTLPEALYAEGRVGKPTVFAGNRLVLATPAKAPKVTSLTGAGRPEVKLAVGSPAVPIGSYTEKVLARLQPAQRRRILTNVRSREPDVKGIVGKLTQGAVDAGFVYVTDVAASKGALKAIELPKALKPSAAYAVAVVKGAKSPGAARRFVAGLVRGRGQRALRAAGFEPPPR